MPALGDLVIMITNSKDVDVVVIKTIDDSILWQ